MRKLYFLTISLIFISFLNLNAQTLLAEFPLTSDGVDITGKNDDMSIRKAPFQNDGIYSNGVYYGNDTTGSHIQTQQIVDFNFDDLTVKVDFLLEEYPDFEKPIVMVGASWRWLSAWMAEDKIALRVNNGSLEETSDVVVSLDEWHTVAVSYSKMNGEARLHLDGTLILTIEVEEVNHGENSRVVNSDGGIGNTYKGYWRNLEIHNSSDISSVEHNRVEEISIKPFGNQVQLTVPFDIINVSLQMFDLSGRSLGEHKLNQGTNNFVVENGNNVILFVLTDQKGNRSVRKINFIK